MATYSDMVTLLLTFFVLLLSFAKTETAKYESALGSIRNAFGGNIFKQGDVLRLGKSPDNKITTLDSVEPVKPFPIDFLTLEGFLDKYEINRASTEDLKEMKKTLMDFELIDHVNIYEMPEGIKVHVKDKIFFRENSTEFTNVDGQIFNRLLNIMRTRKWSLFVQGHASTGESQRGGRMNSLTLSSQRAQKVAEAFMERGVAPEKITSVFYGDSRPDRNYSNSKKFQRRVEFILRKIDLNELGHSVDPREP